MHCSQILSLFESSIPTVRRLHSKNFAVVAFDFSVNEKNSKKDDRLKVPFLCLKDVFDLSANLKDLNVQVFFTQSPKSSILSGIKLNKPQKEYRRGFRSQASMEDKPIHNERVDGIVDKTIKAYKLPPKNSFAVRIGFLEGFADSQNNNKKKKTLADIARSLLSMGFITIIIYQIYKIFIFRGNPADRQRYKSVEIETISKVRFSDVCGVDEAKEELKDVVLYLQDPQKFTSLGAKLPKGILLVGPPGTGKTLLARAVAGEAGVPFFYVAGSEFEEMFVGVGASRVRQLFESARKNAPAIIFIDEIDACGSKRTNNALQPYARQTINQLLQELDGFHKNEPIIVLGATNSPEVLDKALTRPGRFDSQVSVSLPDIAGRKKTLEMYLSRLSNIQSLDHLNLDRMASISGGMSGADISNVVNQAALQAAKMNKLTVTQEDLEFAFDKVKMGPELNSRVRSESELMNTAYHEAGHALVAYYSPAAWDIYKATIRQRGSALGHVAQLPPQQSENGQTKEELIAQMNVAMGGRVAEELLYGEDKVTTGASSDIQTATHIAYTLVCELGMSDKLGLMKYDMNSVSEETKRLVEMEVRRFLQQSYEESKKLLKCKSKEHQLLADSLIKYETLSMEEIKLIIESQDINSVQKFRENNEAKKRENIRKNPFKFPIIDLIPPTIP